MTLIRSRSSADGEVTSQALLKNKIRFVGVGVDVQANGDDEGNAYLKLSQIQLPQVIDYTPSFNFLEDGNMVTESNVNIQLTNGWSTIGIRSNWNGLVGTRQLRGGIYNMRINRSKSIPIIIANNSRVINYRYLSSTNWQIEVDEGEIRLYNPRGVQIWTSNMKIINYNNTGLTLEPGIYTIEVVDEGAITYKEEVTLASSEIIVDTSRYYNPSSYTIFFYGQPYSTVRIGADDNGWLFEKVMDDNGTAYLTQDDGQLQPGSYDNVIINNTSTAFTFTVNDKPFVDLVIYNNRYDYQLSVYAPLNSIVFIRHANGEEYYRTNGGIFFLNYIDNGLILPPDLDLYASYAIDGVESGRTQIPPRVELSAPLLVTTPSYKVYKIRTGPRYEIRVNGKYYGTTDDQGLLTVYSDSLHNIFNSYIDGVIQSTVEINS